VYKQLWMIPNCRDTHLLTMLASSFWKPYLSSRNTLCGKERYTQDAMAGIELILDMSTDQLHTGHTTPQDKRTYYRIMFQFWRIKKISPLPPPPIDYMIEEFSKNILLWRSFVSKNI